MTALQDQPADLHNPPIINISCYKFVPLEDLPQRRLAILQRSRELNLRGTVLLSAEGINLFVAGATESIRGFVAWLQQDPAFADLQPKESPGEYQPFNRMLVKVKREIISFGVAGVDPARQPSPKLSAPELRQWLDEGRPVHLLDTRNDYEYDLGTFDKAIRMGLDHFREFPDAVSRLPESMKDEPIVMFCTGGIRCEKAGPYMQQAGFRKVYQLDGGILKYFELVGGAHYHGECFVFDQRVGVAPTLQETQTTQCFVCQAVVTAAQQQLPSYVSGKSCPACYREPAQSLSDLLHRRQDQIRAATTPLPGSFPCLNRRPLNVPARCAGMTLITFVTDVHPHLPRAEWQRRIEQSELVPAIPVRRRRRAADAVESLPLNPDRVVRDGEKFDVLTPQDVEPDISPDIRILFEDEELIVLSKPAPLPVHACGRFHRNTLRHIVNAVWTPQRPHMVHRLDANTSGVMILCKRKRVAAVIQKQFEQRTVEKSYLARVHGQPADDRFSCSAPLGRNPDQGGVRLIDDGGDDARTDFSVIRRLPDGTAVLRAYPRTGRTNQIRAHLWHLGMPVVGDPAYLPGGRTGENRTLSVSEPRLCLHAELIRLRDETGKLREFADEAPARWFQIEE